MCQPKFVSKLNKGSQLVAVKEVIDATDPGCTCSNEDQQYCVNSQKYKESFQCKFKNLVLPVVQGDNNDQMIELDEDGMQLVVVKDIEAERQSQTAELLTLTTTDKLEEDTCPFDDFDYDNSLNIEEFDNQFQVPCFETNFSQDKTSPQLKKKEEIKTSQCSAHKNSLIDNMNKHPFRNIIFSQKFKDVKKFIEHLACVYKGAYYCVNMKPSTKTVSTKQVMISQNLNAEGQKQKVLLLDLDETLIHSFNIVQYESGENKNVKYQKVRKGFRMRPFLLEFLAEMKKYYDIYVFTAATFNYATSVISVINNGEKLIEGFLCRDQCLLMKNGKFIKDISIIKNRELKDIIIVDNLPHSFCLQMNNGIPILEWIDDKDDKELLYLKDMLIEASGYDDVRKYIGQRINLPKLLEHDFAELLDMI